MSDLIPIGSVHKLVSPSGKIYIGSTKKPLAKRLSQHRAAYKLYLKGPGRYASSTVLFEESSNIKIELLEGIKDCTKYDLLMLEKKYIEENICVNKQTSIQTEAEKKAYQKEYTHLNNAAIRDRTKKWYAENIDEIKERKKLNEAIIKEQSKACYEKHKDERIQKRREYNTIHKASISDKN